MTKKKRRTYNTMTKKKRTYNTMTKKKRDKTQTMIHNTLIRKLSNTNQTTNGGEIKNSGRVSSSSLLMLLLETNNTFDKTIMQFWKS
jgi:hypothetical protein